MSTDTRDGILKYISYHGQARVHNLANELRISKVAIHKQLKKLLMKGLLVRKGRPPLVFYTFPSERTFQSVKTQRLSEYIRRFIEEHFLSITPDGKLLYGMEGFAYWVSTYQKKKTFETIAQEYFATLTEQKKHFFKQGWIDATSKLRSTFRDIYIDHLLFTDIYSYRTFGRTKTAKLVMYAKQTGAKTLIDQISDEVKPLIERVIKTYAINAVSYIPPTVPRPVQFMDEFASRLHLPLPEIVLAKVVAGDIPIPQKTLASVEERITNARNTIYVKSTKPSYANIVLIDDVVGSGASFQETAKKLRQSKICTNKIIAFSLVGDLKGYDVIREI